MNNAGFKRPAQCVILSMMFSALAFADGDAVAIDEFPAAPAPASAAITTPDPDRLRVDIYPIFGWLPFFSSNFTVPPLPNGGAVKASAEARM